MRRPAEAPGRVRAGARLLGDAVADAFRVVRTADPRLLAGAIAWWLFDAAVLWAMLSAFGAPPAVAVVALAYFVGQVGNTLPVPGAVSGGIVGVLVAFGVAADLALLSVLAYRSVAIWLPAPVGLVALGEPAPDARALGARGPRPGLNVPPSGLHPPLSSPSPGCANVCSQRP